MPNLDAQAPERAAAAADAAADAWWSREPAALFAELDSGAPGLAAAEAARRLQSRGANAIDEEPAAGALRLALRQFASPLVLILVFGAGVSAVLREWLDAAIIVVVVCGSAAVGFVQEFRASNAIAQLRRRLALTARVRRDGATVVRPARELVPGDVIELAAGHLVPADGVLLEARDFLVSEATLTGESFPVEKHPGAVAAATPIARRSNAVFLGSSVRSGTATVLVVRTGGATAFGAVAARLRTQAPPTEFARGVQQFGALLLRVMVVMVLFVLVVNQALGRPWVESLLFAVALAVGLSPELLPAIVAVTLSAGARRMAARGVLVRRLEAIENLGSIDVLCTDKTGTLTTGTMTLAGAEDPDGRGSAEVLRWGWLNARFETGIENPLDAALLAAGRDAGLDDAPWRKVDEIPYDFARRRLTIVVAPAGGGPHRIVTKGAVAEVLGCCSAVLQDGVPVPLDEARRARLLEVFAEHGRQGLRTLALATREAAPRPAYGHDDESGLVFAGFLHFADPPKPGVDAVLHALGARGIAVKVITGDNRHVAAHLAARVGLDAQRLLTGEQIAAMRDEALWQRAPQTALFVEVDPQQKERIVRALQHAGHAVGFLGDGINDAPALHAADVGISVDQAVDVARASADVVLLRPDLGVLRQGVEEGRRSFANTLKYIGITTSANFGNMVSMALAAPWLPFLPLTAAQILLNNFLSDLPSLAIAGDRVDDERLRTAQRWDVHDLRRTMLVFGLTSTLFDLLTFWMLLAVFGAAEREFQTAWFVVSVLTELVVVLVLRTMRAPWRSRPGAWLWRLTVLVALAALALPFAGPLGAAFGFVALPPALLAGLLAIVAGYAAATEFVKRRRFAHRRRPRPPRPPRG